MSAQIDRSQVPAPGPAPVVNIGAHKSFVLKNGMRVIVVENHKLPLVSVQVRFDNPPMLQGEYAGYQDLVGELLTSGTARHSKEQLDELIDGMGAELSGTSDGLYASALKKHFPALMDLVSEVVTSATYPNAEFEKAKTRAISGIQSRSDDPDQISDVVGRVLTYGKGYPYGEPTTEKTMGKVQRAQVYAYYQYAFKPAQGYLVMVGDITEAEARAAAERAFGFWQGANLTVTKDTQGRDVLKDLGTITVVERGPEARGVRQVCFVDRPGSAQSVVRVLFPVDLKPNDPMALHAQVMNTILGGGVFNARLMQNLREDKAYTYGAYSNLDADRYCGSFSAGCSVRNSVTDSAVTELMFELEHLQQMGVTAEELSLSKNYMAGSFGRSLEDPRTIARFALNTYLNGLPADHYATYLQRLEKVTAADVQAAAQSFLKPDNASILVVGDKAEVGNKLAPLSFTRAVVYYDINGDVYRENAEMPPAGVTAQTVMDAYLAAIGGKDAAAKVKDLRREYSASMQGMALTMVESQAPGKYAMELRTGDMVLEKTVFDGQRGSGIGMEGTKELVDTELSDARKNTFIFPELHYAELDQRGVANGVLDINGRRAYRVVVDNADGNTFTEYYDAENGLKLRKVENQATEQGTFQVVTDYSDYKPVDGIRFPHTIRQNAGMDITFTLQKIAVNKGVPPSVFKVD
ncbi:MAG TPA: pitrilysin family protein [Flavobacteriales bacterium]